MEAQQGGGRWTLGAGAHYLTGRYGAKTAIDTLYVPLLARYEADAWQATLTVPYVEVRGHGTESGGKAVLDSSEQGVITESGLGDVALSGSYTVYRGAAPWPWIDLTGAVKFGTADPDKQLGTGKTDYVVEGDAYQRVGAAEWFASLGYRVPGSPAGYDYHAVTFLLGGATYPLSASAKAGLMWRGQQAYVKSGKPQSEATAFASWAITARDWLQGYVTRGLAEGSADWGTGVTVGRSF